MVPVGGIALKVIRGVSYPTITDAAERLGVSVSTIRRYIDRGTLDRPEVVAYGMSKLHVFSEEWIKKAKEQILGAGGGDEQDTDDPGPSYRSKLKD